MAPPGQQQQKGGWFPIHLEASNFGNKPVAQFKSRQIWQRRLKAYDGHLAARVRKKMIQSFQLLPQICPLHLLPQKNQKQTNKPAI